MQTAVQRRPTGRGLRGLVLIWTVLPWTAGPVHAAEAPDTLARFAAIDLAAAVNGQVIYALDEQQRTIVAIEPLSEPRQRIAVAATAEDSPRPVAIACIETNTLVAVCLAGESWSLRTWRVKPDSPANPAEPLQTMALGDAPGSSDGVRIAVNASRDWLAVTGLPAPLAPVLRAAIAGIRIGKCTDRGCPHLEPDERPTAMAISPADELVLVSRPATSEPARLSFHDLTGRRLLHLDIDLPAIRDLAFSRSDGALWAVGGTSGSPTQPEGLWRLDAAFQDGHQVVTAVRVFDCTSPRAVVCPSDKGAIVAAKDTILRSASVVANVKDPQP